MDKPSYIIVNETKVPLKLKRERRSSVRYSISKKSINLAVPTYYNREQLVDEFHKISAWANQQFLKSPGIIEQFIQKDYNHKDQFKIYGKNFKLYIYSDNRKGLSAEIEDELVFIKTPESLNRHERNASISNLLSRLFSKHFHPDVSERVQSFNTKFFQEEIKAVRLKNNQSNWGSCSTNKYINLSSRLLFAPPEIMDYVIVHELAHLKEMNHSKKFWKIVESVMPDYKIKDAWLTKQGHQLKF
jgi:predicted metal-dependent hydrolase